MKEPWQMTRAEYRLQFSAPSGSLDLKPLDLHRRGIADGAVNVGIRPYESLADAAAVLEKVGSWREGESHVSYLKRIRAQQFMDGDNTAVDMPADWSEPIPSKHAAAVRQALAEGKPVPAEVLADFPGLKGGAQ